MVQNSGAARTLKRLVNPALWLLAALLFVYFSLKVPSYYAQRRGEFVSYLVSSQAIAAGHGAAHFYDDDLFHKEISDLGYDVQDIFYPNPPTTALLFLPLSGLDFQTARWTWITMSLFFLVLSLAIQFRELKLSPPLGPVVISIVLISQPLHANLRHGQIYTFMLLLATLTWVATRRRKQVFAGIAHALMIAVKLFALPLYLLFLMRRHRKIVWVGLVALSAIILISLPLLTPAAWSASLSIPERMAENPALFSVTAYQSLGSLIRHLFTFDPNWNPQPIANQPALASALFWTLQLLVIIVTACAIRVSREIDLSFAAAIALSIFISPFAQDYTYTVLLLPIVILIAYLRKRPSIRLALPAAIAILLFVSNLPFKSPRLAVGFWALLAYPKLYAALLIWALLVWLAVAGWKEHGELEDATNL